MATTLTCQGHDGPCDNEGFAQRQNTAYDEEHMNWVIQCDECFEHTQAEWDIMWREYWSSRL